MTADQWPGVHDGLPAERYAGGTPCPNPTFCSSFPISIGASGSAAGRQSGVRTPSLDALAARGTAFTNALTPSPLCSPARACLAHGRRYDAQPVKHNQHDVDVSLPNLYRAMRDAG